MIFKIMKKITEKTNRKYSEIKSKSQKQDLADIRHLTCLILRENNYTLTRIGRIVQRDHSTVMYSIEKARDLISLEPKYRILYKDIVNNL